MITVSAAGRRNFRRLPRTPRRSMKARCSWIPMPSLPSAGRPWAAATIDANCRSSASSRLSLRSRSVTQTPSKTPKAENQGSNDRYPDLKLQVPHPMDGPPLVAPPRAERQVRAFAGLRQRLMRGNRSPRCVQLGSPTGPRVFCRSFIIDIAGLRSSEQHHRGQPGVRAVLQAVGDCPCSRLKARLNASSAS